MRLILFAARGASLVKSFSQSQRFNVDQVLVTARGTLQHDQIVTAHYEERDALLYEVNFLSFLAQEMPRLLRQRDSIQGLEDVELAEFGLQEPASAVNEAAEVERRKLLGPKVAQITRCGAQRDESSPEPRQIGRRRIGDDVDIVRSTGMAMEREREAADQDEVDLMFSEKP